MCNPSQYQQLRHPTTRQMAPEPTPSLAGQPEKKRRKAPDLLQKSEICKPLNTLQSLFVNRLEKV